MTRKRGKGTTQQDRDSKEAVNAAVGCGCLASIPVVAILGITGFSFGSAFLWGLSIFLIFFLLVLLGMTLQQGKKTKTEDQAPQAQQNAAVVAHETTPTHHQDVNDAALSRRSDSFAERKAIGTCLTGESLVPVSVVSNIQNTFDFPVHPDIADLLWFSDGPCKNDFDITRPTQQYIEIGGIRIALSILNVYEPSLISTKLPIMRMDSIEHVERPPYFPAYRGLTPEQRNVYWRLLKNPYDATFDIGFVFLLYYGLERHLLTGNYEKAFDVILKLRDVHPNKSFQSYSANALILTCINKQRPDLAYRFMDSLDKEHEFKFSDNLYLVCKYALKIPLTPKDIMRMSKSFEFTNQNYIKKYPEEFEHVLLGNVQQSYGGDSIHVDQFITVAENRKLKQQAVPMFANLSLIENQIGIPLFVESFKLKHSLYNLLEKTHEDVKVLIAQKRKEGTLEPPPKLEKKATQVFDV